MKKFWGGFFLIATLSFGCATHQDRMREPRSLLISGQFQRALEMLQPLAEEKSRDQLVHLLEYATALHIAGRYEDSNKYFLQADRLADELDYASVSKTALATLSSEEALQYKGESYEKLLINAYLALNFMMLEKPESAMVEVRRVNQKINTLRANGRENYEYNPFSHYLSALIYEGERQFDDAYIAYQKAHEIDSRFPLIGEDLVRSATLAQRDDGVKKWTQQYPEVKPQPQWKNRNLGEIVLIHQQGWGPRKRESPGDRRFPILVPEYSMTTAAELEVAGHGRAVAQEVYNLEASAIQTLREDYNWMVARKVGAFVAKEIVADQIRQKDELLGALAWLAMHISDRADLRQWSFLPRAFQVARLKVPGGEHEILVRGLSGSGGTGEVAEPRKVKVRPGKITFVTWRSLR